MEQRTKYCKHCASVIDADCVVCPRCGKQVEAFGGQQAPQNIIINNNNNNNAYAYGGGMANVSPKSWLTTLLLCLFLGWLGAHRFYAGKIGTGILQIILMPFLVGPIWLLIDFIKIIVGSFTDAQGLPIKR